MRRVRIAVTGIGAVSPWGWSAEALWRGLAGGETAIRAPRRFSTAGQRTHLAGEVPDEPEELAAAHPGWERLSRADRFAVAAAAEALAQAGLGQADRQPGRDLPIDSTGVFFGGSTAGMAEGEDFFERLLGLAAEPSRLAQLRSHTLNGPGDAVARRFGLRGPVETLSSACASGALALGAALDALREGEVELALAGGSDSLCQLTYAGFNALRAVDEGPSRPFRAGRAGLSLGEGAGVLVLETLECARARGAAVLAELLGVGASCDAHHMTAPHPEGDGAALAMRWALEDAGLAPAAVSFVNAHGTGTPLNDAAEAKALHQVFGGVVSGSSASGAGCSVPVTSTKGAVGHLLGSSGAIEAVATVLCLEAGAVHATAGAGAADAALGVDVVLGAPRPLPPGAAAVSTSFAFGGSNAAVVLGDRARAEGR